MSAGIRVLLRGQEGQECFPHHREHRSASAAHQVWVSSTGRVHAQGASLWPGGELSSGRGYQAIFRCHLPCRSRCFRGSSRCSCCQIIITSLLGCGGRTSTASLCTSSPPHPSSLLPPTLLFVFSSPVLIFAFHSSFFSPVLTVLVIF